MRINFLKIFNIFILINIILKFSFKDTSLIFNLLQLSHSRNKKKVNYIVFVAKLS